MNKQKPPKGIEWTRIVTVDGIQLPGWTWNPTAGCLHGCTWKMPDGSVAECYAKTIAERFTKAYPQGFEHHYWRPHELNAPLKVKQPAGIFVGSMADLFGHWVADEQIQQVIDVMEEADWHTFQVLTKNPKRLQDFQFPKNVWVGFSIPAGRMMSKDGGARVLNTYLEHMALVKASVRFISIEPLWFNVAKVLERYWWQNEELPFEWAIIGAASNGAKTYMPDVDHFTYLSKYLIWSGIPQFFKGNLHDLLEADKDWREEFPIVKSLKPLMQMRMF